MSMKGPFQLVAGHPALDFANTLDWRFDPERRIDLLRSYESLLEFEVQSGIISGTQAKRLLSQTSKRDSARALQRAIDLREVIDPLFRSVALGDRPRAGALDRFNEFLVELQIPASVVLRGSEFLLAPGDFSNRADGPLWPIVEGAARLLTSRERDQIRECGEPTCRWLFLDSSKNHSRQWCSMKICGNRAKIRRFRDRQIAAKETLS